MFAKAQEAFDQANQAQFESYEARKQKNLAPSVESAYLIRDEDIERHFAPKTQVAPPTAFSPSMPMKVIAQSHEEAFRYAWVACMLPETKSHLMLWTDASVMGKWGKSAGYAVAMKRDGEWYTITDGTANVYQTVNTAELRAIQYALQFAVQEVHHESSTESPRAVTVFTDSTSALCAINLGCIKPQTWTDLKSGDVLDAVQQHIYALERAGVKLEFRWVPRGRVEGNIVADRAAAQARIAHKVAELGCEAGERLGLGFRAPGARQGRSAQVRDPDQEAKRKLKSKRRLKKERRRMRLRQSNV